MDKVTRQYPQTTNLFEDKGEPKRYRTEVLPLTSLNAIPLGQTGSRVWSGAEVDYIPIATLSPPE